QNTLIFLDEIQQYPQYFTLLKFFREDHRYRFVSSGSLLGTKLRKTTSLPVGSVIIKQMCQLDFEEFLIANGMGHEAIEGLRQKYFKREALDESMHKYVLDLFRRYLLVGGLPDAVNTYLSTHNIMLVRDVHNSIMEMYRADASKYEKEAMRKLLIRKIYDMIPSQLENKKKRMVFRDIRDRKGDRFETYLEEFEYLTTSGIAIEVKAISNPAYPLAESMQKNLLKLYLNDVGLFTAQLYGADITPVLNDEESINLGSVYENVVAQQLKAQGREVFYYDNRHKGEVDYLIDNPANASTLPIEVKSGKDYKRHSALTNVVSNPDYHIKEAIGLSNAREVERDGKITYLPIYFSTFLSDLPNPQNIYF
ncbi:MAG: ATP-binding protein, partial [Bacteroidales bacterium]|nr:ATP-binding protein [Bacteroidales bacterium]